MPDFYDKNVMDKPLDKSGYTCSWVLNKIYENSQEFRDLLGDGHVIFIFVEDISVGQGFNANVFKTIVKFDDPTKKDYIFCMKIPHSESFAEIFFKNEENPENLPKIEKAKLIAGLHNRECLYYDLLKNAKKFWPIPKIYFVKHANLEEKEIGAVFMEYLSDGKTMGLHYPVDAEKVKSAIRCLAKFHAHLWSTQNNIEWKNKFPEIPYATYEAIDFLKYMLLKSIELRPDDYSLFGQLGEVFLDQDFAIMCTRECCTKLGIPQVLVHGDFWTNNILWKLRPDGTLSNDVRAFIDAQVCFEGNPAFDMARLIVLNTDGDVRRELETYICDVYMENLVEISKILGSTVPFTVEQFETAYKYAMVHETKNLLCMTNFLTSMIPENEPDLGIHKARIEKVVLRTKLALEDALKYLKELVPEKF